jgi:C4-dicarboxylate transporter DctQ subunit
MDMKPFSKMGAFSMNLLTKLERTFDKIISFFAFIAGILLCFILLSVCLEVLMRYFLNSPLQWVIELTEYSLLYITFLGTAWLLKSEGHITVDIITIQLSPKTQARLKIFSSLIGIFVSLCLIWYGFEVSWSNYKDGIYNITLLEFPRAPILAIIPIGSLLLLLQFIRAACQSLAFLMDKNSMNRSDNQKER